MTSLNHNKYNKAITHYNMSYGSIILNNLKKIKLFKFYIYVEKI